MFYNGRSVTARRGVGFDKDWSASVDKCLLKSPKGESAEEWSETMWGFSVPDVIDKRNKLEIMFVHAARFNFRVGEIELNPFRMLL